MFSLKVLTNSHFGVRLPRAGLNLKRNDTR
nr:MAG TPA: hypothetical protein [Caudoviricetes sp.]